MTGSLNTTLKGHIILLIKPRVRYVCRQGTTSRENCMRYCVSSTFWKSYVFWKINLNSGARGGVVVKALRYKPAGRGFDSRWCQWNFSVTQSFRSHYDPEIDSASNRNEYQVYFLGVKGGRSVRLTTLPPSCAVIMKSGNLNFLEPSGPLEACNWTALPSILNNNLNKSVYMKWSFWWPNKVRWFFQEQVAAHLT
jgi:hypothetical protein